MAEAKEKKYYELLKEWLSETPIEKVTWQYKDGTTFSMTAKEFALWLKNLLVEGMLSSHRPIIKRELLPNEE